MEPCSVLRRLWNTVMRLLKLHRSMPASGSSKMDSREWRKKHGGDLYALDLAAGEGGVDLAVDVIARAQAHLTEYVAEFGLGELFARGQFQKLAHHQPLEAHRLLEGVADAAFGALGDVQIGDVLAVEQYAPALGPFQTGDDLGQRGLAAAVGAGDDHQRIVRHGQAHALQNALPVRGAPRNILQLQHLLPHVLCCARAAVQPISIIRRNGGLSNEIFARLPLIDKHISPPRNRCAGRFTGTCP